MNDDESGSMEKERDDKLREKIAADVRGGTDLSALLDKIVSGLPKIDSKLPPLILTGSPGMGKSEYVKKMAEMMSKSSTSHDKHIIVFTDDDIAPLDKGTLDNILKNLPPIDPNLKSRFNNIVLTPPSPDMMKKVADIHLSKKGVDGEMRDIIREIAAEHIAKHGTDGGARDVLDVVDDLIANPNAPEIVAKQKQRADARHLTASKVEGAALAETMRKGIKVVVRPMKPVRFK